MTPVNCWPGTPGVIGKVHATVVVLPASSLSRWQVPDADCPFTVREPETTDVSALPELRSFTEQVMPVVPVQLLEVT